MEILFLEDEPTIQEVLSYMKENRKEIATIMLTALEDETAG